ncbi:MAG: glycosyltransferase [Vicinamibacterales bacterium]
MLILLENLPLARDRRVQRQCRALLAAGYGVTVVCPRSNAPLPAELEPVVLRTWRAPKEGGGYRHFALEYGVALAASAAHTLRAYLAEGFDAIQACNPPDLYFLVALPFRAVRIPFVYDQHDPAPELFAARYGSRGGPLLRVLHRLERASCATAARVITTNGSLARRAVRHAGCDAARVRVVRNGPELAQTLPGPAHPDLRRGRRHLICWHGVMGVHDGIDVALATVAELVHRHGRRDCQVTFLGDGEGRAAAERLAAELRVEDVVEFRGWVDRDTIAQYLATADVGLSPDPRRVGTEQTTTMKVLEYLACGVPVVAFDLHETRASAGAAGTYAAEDSPAALADAVDALLRDPARRARMGRIGRHRVRTELAWEHQQPLYTALFDDLLRPGDPTDPEPSTIPGGMVSAGVGAVRERVAVGKRDAVGDRVVAGSGGRRTRSQELITVVVPTRGRIATLGPALRSIVSQQGVQVDVVVVHDGDDRRAVDDTAAEHGERVAVAHITGRGAGHSRNQGIRRSRGAWVAFCDDDDLWAPDKLRRQLCAIEQAGATWACCGAVRVDAGLRVIGHERPDAGGLQRLASFNAVPAGGSGMLVAADCLRAAGPFDESLTNAEDWDQWIRVARTGAGALVDRPLVAYRVWEGNKSADLDGVRRSIRRILERNGTWPPDAAARDQWDRYLLTKSTGPRHRRSSAAMSARLALRHRRPRTLVRAGVVLVAPDAVARRDAALRAAGVPADWRAEADAWLLAYRDGVA